MYTRQEWLKTAEGKELQETTTEEIQTSQETEETKDNQRQSII